MAYSSFLGGSGSPDNPQGNENGGFYAGDIAEVIAADSHGHAFVSGLSYSQNFPTSIAALQHHDIEGSDDNVGTYGTAFVTMLNAAGSHILYSTYFGGNSNSVLPATGNALSIEVNGIAVDESDNAYVTGLANTPDFPIVGGACQTTNSMYGKAFVTKLNSTGSALIYSTLLGGSDGDAGTGIAVDSTGHAYVTGRTYSVDFPITPGAYQTTAGGGFLTKMNQAGTAPIYSSYLPDQTFTLAIDASGNAYVVGTSSDSSNFPTSPGAYNTTGTYPHFVMRLSRRSAEAKFQPGR